MKKDYSAVLSEVMIHKFCKQIRIDKSYHLALDKFWKQDLFYTNNWLYAVFILLKLVHRFPGLVRKLKMFFETKGHF